MNVSDLRGILTYIPRFRERVFVFSIDGAIIAHENFSNLILDLAVLRSLSIKVVLVHGAAHQIRRLGRDQGVALTNADGTGVTDAATLDVATTAASKVTHALLEDLASIDLRAAATNAIIAHPYGIIGGVDHLLTGRVERIDTDFLSHLLEKDIIPVIPPLGFDGEGRTYRCNSDAVAVAVAEALKAAKLLFLGPNPGLLNGTRLITQMPVEEAEAYLKKNRGEIQDDLRSKLEHGIRACREGVNRVHILDGRVDESILSEVFSNEGVGTMIYANEYQQIRRALKKDIRNILALIQQSMNNEELVRRSRQEISEKIGDYHVFEIDRNIVGCVAVHLYPETHQAEIACLSVARGHENQGIGRKLMAFAEGVARDRGASALIALSTQTFNYFQQKGGFREGSPGDLPTERRTKYEQSNRRSKVLIKDLTAMPVLAAPTGK
jgi:amino-acid N-acetyltransferase